MSDVVLKTIIAEAGGDPAAMAAVAAVIHNRAVAQGKTPEQIVKARGQFEGYSNPGPASVKAQNDPNVRARAQQVWSGVKSGSIADPTNGATMYHADYVTPYWAKSANKNGTVNIGGNVFYKGSGTPQTALAAIDRAVAPNPQSRPPALAYGDAPASVRAISVKPNGQPADLMSGLGAKYPGLNFTMSGTTDAAVTGIDRPPAVPPAVPRVASLAPAVPQQQLINHPVKSIPINLATGNAYGVNSPPSLQDAVNAKAGRIAAGQEALTPVMRSVPPKTDFTLFSKPDAQDFTQRADAFRAAHPVPTKVAAAKPQVDNIGYGPTQGGIDAMSRTYVPAPKNGYIMPSAINNGANYTTAMTGWNGPLGKDISTSPLKSIPKPPEMYQPPNRPTPAQMAAINAVPQSASFPPFTPNGMKPTQVASAPVNGASPLDNRYLGLTTTPPVAPGVAAMPPVNPLPHVGRPIKITVPYSVPPPVPRPVPSYRLPNVPTAPKPTFPSQVWNAATTAVNHSPVGHTAQLLTGKPVTGGLLAMLQGTPIQAGRLINGGVLSQPQTAFTASQAAAGSPIALASSGGGGLAGGSLFDRNAQLPGSMDNRRWAGDGY